MQTELELSTPRQLSLCTNCQFAAPTCSIIWALLLHVVLYFFANCNDVSRGRDRTRILSLNSMNANFIRVIIKINLFHCLSYGRRPRWGRASNGFRRTDRPQYMSFKKKGECFSYRCLLRSYDNWDDNKPTPNVNQWWVTSTKSQTRVYLHTSYLPI